MVAAKQKTFFKYC